MQNSTYHLVETERNVKSCLQIFVRDGKGKKLRSPLESPAKKLCTGRIHMTSNILSKLFPVIYYAGFNEKWLWSTSSIRELTFSLRKNMAAKIP